MNAHPRPAQRPGSVLVLVVAALAMLAFLGALFLTSVRAHRVPADPRGNPVSRTAQTDLNLVLESVHTEIARQLKDDVFAPASGNGFDVSAGVEPYDRPWTNPSVTTARGTPLLDGSTETGIYGGEHDDTWLASTFPHLDSAGVWRWRQISSLTGGSFAAVDADAGVANPANRVYGTGDDRVVWPGPTGGRGADADYYQKSLVNGSDYNLAAFGDNASQGATPSTGDPPLLVDADGDGMPDSRFERAPLMQKDGIEYFMAVRVVDLASLLNIDHAVTAVEHDGATASLDAGGDAPRPQSPADLDTGLFLLRNPPPAPAAPWTAVGGDTLFGEFTGENGAGGNPGLYDLRALDPNNSTHDRTNRLGAADRLEVASERNPYGDVTAGNKARLPLGLEAELRYRGGVYDFPGDSLLRDVAPQLSAEPRTESTRTDLGGFDSTTRNNLVTRGMVGDLFGYQRLSSNPTAQTPTPFPRAYLTTRSAANAWRPPLPGEASAGVPEARRDLNAGFTTLNGSSPTSTRESVVTAPAAPVGPDNFPYLQAAEVATLENEVRRFLADTVLPSTLAPASFPLDATDAATLRNSFYTPTPASQFTDSDITGAPALAPPNRPILPPAAFTARPAPLGGQFDNTDVDRFATQFAANLQDYRDADNRITRLDTIDGAGGGSEPPRYGMEALPAIIEVYAQRLYEVSAIAANSDPTLQNVTWQEQGDPGYAIEIGNPFPRPISLQNVHVFFVHDEGTTINEQRLETGVADDSDLDAIAGAALAAAPGAPTDDPGTVFNEARMLQPGQSVVLYVDSDSTGSLGSDAAATDIIGGAGGRIGGASPDVVQVQVPLTYGGWPAFDGGAGDPGFDTLRVELRAELDRSPPPSAPPFNIMSFAYQAAPMISLPDEWVDEAVGSTDTTNAAYVDDGTVTGTAERGFLQAWASGALRESRFHMLALPPAEFSFEVPPATDPRPSGTVRYPGNRNGAGPAYAYEAGGEFLGDDAPTKPAPAYFAATAVPPSEDQLLIADHPEHRLLSGMELALMAVLGPQEPSTAGNPFTARTIPEVWDDDEAVVEDHRLGFPLGRPIDNRGAGATRGRIDGEGAGGATGNLPVTPSWFVPHFAHLLSAVTTVPVADAATPPQPNPTVPGVMNLNTVPLSLLSDTLPLAEDKARRLAAKVVGRALEEYDLAVDDGVTRNWGGAAAPSPGLPIVADLVNQPALRYLANVNLPANETATYGGDTFELPEFGSGTATIRTDFLPSPGSVAGGADGVEDDREESLLPMMVLDQVSGTRSDVFVAYVLLHGYRSGAFEDGPVETLRTISLFDRSGMKTVDDDVQVEVLMRLPSLTGR